jgi:hypothetical protein
MPAAERDKHYRWILNQLDLHLEDRQDLIRRGYTDEQIERAGHKSVDRWQKLPGKLPLNLPGVNSRGDGLITHTAGYLCPIADCDGLIVGFQVRKRHLAPDDDQRYYFLSQNGSIRISDQVPLAVFEPIERKADYYGLAEGVGSKPFLACDRLGVPVIGAAGGNWASSAVHLKNSLQKLGAKSGDKVVLFADAGSPKNPSVLRQYKRAVSELKQEGYQPLIAWWGQLDKSHPDIDELSSIEAIEFITPKRFWDICNHISKQAQRDEKLRQQRLKTEEDFLCLESEEIDKSVSKEALPKEVPQPTSIPNQQTSKGKSQKPGNSLSRTTNQKLHSLPQSTTFNISNPPLTASSPTQCLKDGMLKVLPIPESVASCLTTEQKAPRQERKWFETVLKRIKKVFLRNAKKEKAPRLGFKCFKEDNPDFEEKIRQVQRKLRSLSYEADIDLSQRYLPLREKQKP